MASLNAPSPDLYGRALLDYLKGRRLPVHLRRGDGRLAVLDLKSYFGGPELFTPMERCIVAHARGAVLDLGAGGGRIAAHLQSMAGPDQDVTEVVAVDASQGACSCLRRFGLRSVVHSPWQRVMESGIWHGRFDSVVLAGGNLGLAGDPSGLAVMLGWLRGLLRPCGTILATGLAPWPPPGGCDALPVRFRVEYAGRVGEWFAWLTLTPAALELAAASEGLRVERWLLPADHADFGAQLVRI
ncbi:MAG: class I SAM-dependent methyltransferase [Bacillota bacterium]|nr:class I SAM-dependent methyltransferase [Bacillota bacterium]